MFSFNSHKLSKTTKKLGGWLKRPQWNAWSFIGWPVLKHLEAFPWDPGKHLDHIQLPWYCHPCPHHHHHRHCQPDAGLRWKPWAMESLANVGGRVGRDHGHGHLRVWSWQTGILTQLTITLDARPERRGRTNVWIDDERANSWSCESSVHAKISLQMMGWVDHGHGQSGGREAYDGHRWRMSKMWMPSWQRGKSG